MANITKVYLLNVPLENDYNHTLYFTSAAEQQAYFQSRLVKSFTDFSYQRKDEIIRVPALYDNIMNCNYVMYQNPSQSNKWYYAFITELKYVNDGMTEAHIETDVMQTWMFDYTIKQSFIEREHVNDDTAGLHTIAEGLELGEYICRNHAKADYGSDGLAIVVGTTEDTEGDQVNGMMYNNIYSGLKYYSFKNSDVNENGVKKLNIFLDGFGSGKAEAIKCMFLAPESISIVKDDNIVTGTNYVSTRYINVPEGGTINKNISFTKNLDGYVPNNKKLLCYPYRYLLATNNCGGSAMYKHEDFYTISETDYTEKTPATPQFIIEGCLTPGCSVRMVPRNYKGAARNDEEGLNLGKYPILNWTSDYFTNWLTQNGVNIGVTAASSIASIVGGAVAVASTPATAGGGAVVGAGMIVSGVLGVASAVGEVTKASIVPAQSSGNLNNGDIITASGQNDFHFYEMTIKEEYAKIIDKYFDMFGYKVNRVGVPLKGHRAQHWFTKTIDVEIDGAIPQTDIQKIKNCYNKGISFWKNPEVIHHYEMPNAIV